MYFLRELTCLKTQIYITFVCIWSQGFERCACLARHNRVVQYWLAIVATFSLFGAEIAFAIQAANK